MNDETQQQLQAHRDAWYSLPWLVNGTADAADRERTLAHLAQCDDCRDELAFQYQLQQAMAADVPAPHDAEPALQRLMARVEMVDGAESTAERPRGRRWVVALAAAVAVQAVALAALGGLLWGQHRAAYETLTSSASSPSAVVIRLVPAPTLRLAELRALLDRHRLRVVDSSGDAAVLGLAGWPAAPVDVAATVQRLRKDPAVLLAEPVQTAAPR